MTAVPSPLFGGVDVVGDTDDQDAGALLQGTPAVFDTCGAVQGVATGEVVVLPARLHFRRAVAEVLGVGARLPFLMLPGGAAVAIFRQIAHEHGPATASGAVLIATAKSARRTGAPGPADAGIRGALPR